jgi:hypothetical protein
MRLSSGTVRTERCRPVCYNCGSLVAAETLGRRCYGMEIDPHYVHLTIERWQGLTGQAASRVDDWPFPIRSPDTVARRRPRPYHRATAPVPT